MTRYHLSETGKEAVAAAADTVRDGGVVIYPTETAYAVGGDAVNKEVIDRVYAAKQRPRDKGLTTVVADLAMAEEYCLLTDKEKKLCDMFMPGPLTLIAEKKPRVPDSLNPDFVFRVPGSDVARILSERSDTPVISTSANLSGNPASYTVDSIDEQVRDYADVILDAGKLEEQPVSTLVRVENGAVDVVREGAIPAEKLKNVL